MVEVFKTSIRKISHADKLVELLHKYFPGNKINFDLKDCDNILRIEGENFVIQNIVMVINENGFNCSVLQ